ncbi:hypothetical protein M426DRAFT_321229 [Hypoxylon sp. CI-4A]|nr:hypothetical protein M426DRAFT_321229 [Hypoxylon sp. CI-4A]
MAVAMQFGCATADLVVARQKSSTSLDTPTSTTAIQTRAEAAATSTDSDATSDVVSAPRVTTSPFANITSAAGPLTETLGGIQPSSTDLGSLTESVGDSSLNAAATPVGMGAGVLAGVLGIVAAAL